VRGAGPKGGRKAKIKEKGGGGNLKKGFISGACNSLDGRKNRGSFNCVQGRRVGKETDIFYSTKAEKRRKKNEGKADRDEKKGISVGYLEKPRFTSSV